MTETTAAGDAVAFELDESQRAVAEAPADARLLVIAGAGQGKTEVVASRIEYLVEDEGLSASTEIMALSFSRAAVHAVRTRLDVRDIARTDVRTFDSLASYLLSQNGIEPAGDFNERVRAATRLLTTSAEVDGVEDIAHIILDEVQDLVGDRAEMVLALLSRLDESAGFTALGDPLQALYDFTLDDSRSKLTSSEFIDALTKSHGGTELSLDRNYRARGEFPRGVIELGNKMRDEQRGEAAQIITEFESTLPHSGEIRDWHFLDDASAGRTAVLCATNGEVLRVSNVLSEQGIDHVVRRPAQDFGAAKWIAELFEGVEGPELARSDVESAIESKLAARLRDEAWYLLKGAEGRSRTMNQLNLPRLRSLISTHAMPLTLTEPDQAHVIVSTIHRAKGLEFERAYFVHPNSPMNDQNDWPAIRQRYVALSRARDMVAVIDIPTEWVWFDKRNGRSRERKKGKSGKHYTLAVELRGNDVMDSRPLQGDPRRAHEIQRNLAEVSPGQEIFGVFDPTQSTADKPIFCLSTSKGAELGFTDKWFGRALAYDFGWRREFRDGWDGAVVEGVRLVSVETVAGDPRVTEAAGLGPSGFWLVPRVFGLVAPKPS